MAEGSMLGVVDGPLELARKRLQRAAVVYGDAPARSSEALAAQRELEVAARVFADAYKAARAAQS